MRRPLVIAALAAACSCGEGRGGLSVTVDGNPPVVGVDRLRVTVRDVSISPPSDASPFELPIAAPHTIDPAVTFTLGFDRGLSDRVRITVDAIGADGAIVASGDRESAVVPGALDSVAIALAGVAVPDGGSDFAPSDSGGGADAAAVDAPSVDAVSVDAAGGDLPAVDLAIAEIGAPDLVTFDQLASDLTKPDLGTADSATADLAKADLTTLDSAVPDMAPVFAFSARAVPPVPNVSGWIGPIAAGDLDHPRGGGPPVRQRRSHPPQQRPRADAGRPHPDGHRRRRRERRRRARRGGRQQRLR